jgi:predicted nucleic acid-binding protein
MTYLLDTSALLAHYRNEPGGQQVQALFDRQEADLLVASVSLPEFARRLRDLGASAGQARDVLGRYLQALTDVVSIDAAVAGASFDLICEVHQRLPLIDALIVSAARSRKACLVHRDKHLRAIPAGVVRQIELRAEDARPGA